MTTTTKQVLINIPETVEAWGTTLYPGNYRVVMPEYYDEASVTGVDIICDCQMYIEEDNNEN
jgi:hypothetical protein